MFKIAWNAQRNRKVGWPYQYCVDTRDGEEFVSRFERRDSFNLQYHQRICVHELDHISESMLLIGELRAARP